MVWPVTEVPFAPFKSMFSSFGWGTFPGMKLTLLAYADAIRSNVAKAVPSIWVVTCLIFVLLHLPFKMIVGPSHRPSQGLGILQRKRLRAAEGVGEPSIGAWHFFLSPQNTRNRSHDELRYQK